MTLLSCEPAQQIWVHLSACGITLKCLVELGLTWWCRDYSDKIFGSIKGLDACLGLELRNGSENSTFFTGSPPPGSMVLAG